MTTENQSIEDMRYDLDLLNKNKVDLIYWIENGNWVGYSEALKARKSKLKILDKKIQTLMNKINSFKSPSEIMSDVVSGIKQSYDIIHGNQDSFDNAKSLDECTYCNQKYPEGSEHDCEVFCDCGRTGCMKCISTGTH